MIDEGIEYSSQTRKPPIFVPSLDGLLAPSYAVARARRMGDWKSGQPEGAAPFLGELNKRFRVRRLLGSGGMSIVLEAHDEKLDREVAIKLIRVGSGADARARRLLREAKAVSRLRSRHVASVLDWGWLDAQAPFIVMELLNGRDLGTVLRTDGPLPLGRALRCMVAACDALVEAHSAGIIHRDVKPSNLFVVAEQSADELVKVLDFGLAKDLHADGGSMSLTLGAHLLGTPRYMAPEQLTHNATLDQRVDVWAAAVTLYELVTGRAPFEGKTKGELWHSILNEPARRLTQDLERAPAKLEALLLSGLEKNPAARLSDLRRFSEILQGLLRDLPSAELAEPGKPVERASAESSATLTPSSVVLPSRPGKRRHAWLHLSKATKTRRSRLVLAGFAVALLTASALALAPETEAPASTIPQVVRKAEGKDSMKLAERAADPVVEVTPSPRPAVTSSFTLVGDVSGASRRRSRKQPISAPSAIAETPPEAPSEQTVPVSGAELDRALRTRR
jgi:serine/threonine protein kinase